MRSEVFPTPRDEQASQNPNEFLRPILVDGTTQGLEVSRFSVDEFARSDFKEIFFETESGNIYCIYREDESRRLAIMEAKGNEGKGREARGFFLKDEDMTGCVLQVGAPFRFSRGNTTLVKQVVLVGSTQYFVGEPDPDTADNIAATQTEGRRTDIRKQFISALKKQADT